MADELIAPVAAEPADSTERLAALSRADLQTWREKGTLPEPAPVQAEGATPAELPETDAIEDTPEPTAPVHGADARPATPEAKISNRQKHLNELTRRATQAEIERDEARAALARIGQPAKPVAEDTPRSQAPALDPNDPEPVFDSFLDQPDPYQAHLRAVAAWDRRQEWKADQQRQAQQRAVQSAQEQFSAYLTRETAIRATVPDFDAKTAAVRGLIDVRTPLGNAVIDSPVGPQLLVHFADHPDDFQRIGALGVTNLPAALRALGKLEATLEQPSTASAAAVLPTKTVSSAPAVPTTLGTRPADPADAEAGAVARGDFRAFKEAANRRDELKVRTR